MRIEKTNMRIGGNENENRIENTIVRIEKANMRIELRIPGETVMQSMRIEKVHENREDEHDNRENCHENRENFHENRENFHENRESNIRIGETVMQSTRIEKTNMRPREPLGPH
jgi:hypothetical protein